MEETPNRPKRKKIYEFKKLYIINNVYRLNYKNHSNCFMNFTFIYLLFDFVKCFVFCNRFWKFWKAIKNAISKV